jgi:hypothetical protein
MVTAALFAFSAVAHHAAAAGMSTESGMAMPAATADMTSHDDMPCRMSSDCSDDMSTLAMACFAHCATAVGILAEAALVPVRMVAHQLKAPVVRPLASLHGPPEPHPPKTRILI